MVTFRLFHFYCPISGIEILISWQPYLVCVLHFVYVNMQTSAQPLCLFSLLKYFKESQKGSDLINWNCDSVWIMFNPD